MKKRRVLMELRDVWRTYTLRKGTEVNALRGLSLKIYQGEMVAIIGPSGSGKSSAMYIIGALDKPTKGKAFLKGQDITRFHQNHLAMMRRREIGFVFQSYNLIPEYTAVQNVWMPLLFEDVPKDEREARAKKILTDLGLGHRLDHKPPEMSGGEQQRVAIARALINNPKVILGDEPTGNVDTKTGEEIIAILKKLHKKGKTVILVTHDPRIASHCQRKIHIIDGKVSQKGGKK